MFKIFLSLAFSLYLISGPLAAMEEGPEELDFFGDPVVHQPVAPPVKAVRVIDEKYRKIFMSDEEDDKQFDLEKIKIDRPLPDEVFTKKELKLIKKYAIRLLNETTENDLVIFLGRSPWIYAYYWETNQYDRNYFSVSFSGNPYNEKIDGISGPTQEHLEAYAKYLDLVGVKKDLESFDYESGRVVLVDYTIGGSGISQFARLLKHIDLIGDHSKVLFAVTNDSFSQITMENKDYAVQKTIRSMNFTFQYEIFPYAFHSLGQAEIGYKMGKWEFSMPELGKYKLESWLTVNPMDFPNTGNIEIVRENAKKVWKKSPKDEEKPIFSTPKNEEKSIFCTLI